MIASLQGLLAEKKPPRFVLDVQGVGYELLSPMPTFYKLPELGQTVTVLTHLVVRENSHTLFAFLAEHDRRLFQELIKVSGIGPKSALAILSGMDALAFRACILSDDFQSLTRVPGVGAKTAARLIVEMKNRFDDEFWNSLASHEDAATATEAPPDHVREAEQALQSLGYKATDAKRMIKRIDQPTASVEEIIRIALRNSWNAKKS